MKFLKVVIALLIVSSCSTSGSSTQVIDKADARYQTLLNMSLPDFYGTLAVASLVGSECSNLERHAKVDLELNERRNEQGNGSFAALTQREPIRDAQASMSQAFKSKHGSNLCSVATRDFEKAQKPYTFFLVPVT